MINDFIERQIARANVKMLEDGTYYASVPRLRGVWANGATKTACLRELREVVEEWLLLKVSSHEHVPGFAFRPPTRVAHA